MTTPPQSLRDALAAGGLVVCTGPQIDVAAGLPSMAELARTLLDHADPQSLDATEVEVALAEDRHGDAFEALVFALGRSTVHRRVADRLGTGYSIPPALAAIARLPGLRAVYTTSLVDGLLDRAFGGRWPSHGVPRAYLAQKQRLLFHLRGTVGRAESWVLTAEQERRELRSESARGQLLGAVYLAHHLLLVGFDIDGPALRQLLGMLPATEPGLVPEHFVVTEGPCSPEARRRLARHGFEVLGGGAEPLLAALGGSPESTVTAAPSEHSPYPGLEAFGEDRAASFFGRHMEVSQAAARLGGPAGSEHRRWLSVEGPSGVGKSSFVHAGVVPALRNGYADGTPERWGVANMRPGTAPLQRLIEAVLGALESIGASAPPLSSTLERVRRHPSALAELVTDRVPSGCGVLLVIDQLEEVVTFADKAERVPFGLALAQALGEPLYLVTTIRTDFVPTLLAQLPPLASLLNERAERFALPPIGRVGLREAILEPAAREGVRIEPDVVETILADAGDSTQTDGPDGQGRTSGSALPLVAHVLRTLWDAGAADDRVISLDEYQTLGGVRRALSESAERALAGLDDVALEAAEALLLGLVRIRSDGEPTRRTLDRDEAIALAGGGADGTALLLRLSGGASAKGDDASRARLLVVRREGEDERVDLVHEALLRDWDRYRALVDRNRRLLLLDDELERRARRWEDAGRPMEDLPAGQELADLLEGRPRGAGASRSREYQHALRASEARRKRAARRTTLAWMSAAVVVAIASGVVAKILIDRNEELQRQEEEIQSKSGQLDDQTNINKAVEASRNARGRMDAEPVLLMIEALGAYETNSSTPTPPEVYNRAYDVLQMPGVVGRVAEVREHPEYIWGAVLSPDGTDIVTTSIDGMVRRSALTSGEGKTIAELGPTAPPYALEFSGDRLRMITGGPDSTLRIWTLEPGEEPTESSIPFPKDGVAVLSRAGNRLATSDLEVDATVRLWDAESGRALATVENIFTPMGLEFSTDGASLVTSDFDGPTRVWSTESGERLASIEGYVPVGSGILSQDGSRLVTFPFDRGATMWDLSSGDAIGSLRRDSIDRASMAALSADGSRLVTATRNGTPSLWDFESNTEVARLLGHASQVGNVVFSPEGTALATIADDSVRLWDSRSGEGRATLIGHGSPFRNSVTFSPDGRHLVTITENVATTWELRTSKYPIRLGSPSRSVDAMAFSPDGDRLLTAGISERTHSWVLGSGTMQEFAIEFTGEPAVAFPDTPRQAMARGDTVEVRTLGTDDAPLRLRHDNDVRGLTMSPDGTRLVTIENTGFGRLWNAHSGEELASFSLYEDVYYSGPQAAFSLDSRRLATTGHGSMQFWDARSGEELPLFDLGPAAPIALSSDGRLGAAFVRGPQVLSIADLDSRAFVTGLSVPGESIHALHFSPNDRTLATNDYGNTVSLWDIESKKRAATLTHQTPVRAIAFSPDGKHLAVATSDEVVVWPLPHALMETLCERVRGMLEYQRVASLCDPLG